LIVFLPANANSGSCWGSLSKYSASI